jgi:hypothetical protein
MEPKRNKKKSKENKKKSKKDSTSMEKNPQEPKRPIYSYTTGYARLSNKPQWGDLFQNFKEG